MVEIVYTNDAKYKFANIAIVGEPKTGKTHFLGTAPTDEILILNIMAESGMLTLSDQKIATIQIGKKDPMGKTDYLKDMRDAIAWVKNNGQKFNYIAIDSFSQLQKALVKEVPYQSKYDRWTNIKQVVREIVDDIKRLPMHSVFTFELEKTKDEETGSFVYIPGVEGSKIQHEVLHWFDFNFYFDKVRQGDDLIYRCLTKSTNKIPAGGRENSKIKLPEVIINPNLKDMTIQMFGIVDKVDQKKQLEAIAVENKQMIKNILTKLGKKVDIKTFKEIYSIKSENDDIDSVIKAIPAEKEMEALNQLKTFAKQQKIM